MHPLRSVVFALPLVAACGSSEPAAPAVTTGGASGAGARAGSSSGSAGSGALAAGSGGLAGTAAAGAAGRAGADSGGAAGAGTAGAAGSDVTGSGGSTVVKGGAAGAAGAGGAAGGQGGSSSNLSGFGGAAGQAGSSTNLSGSGGTAGQAGSSSGGGGVSSGGAAGASSGASGSSSGAAGTSSGGAAGAGGGSVCGAEKAPCAADSYCDTDSGMCRACGDLSSLRFGQPVLRLGPVAGQQDLAFPRVGNLGKGRVLSYRATANSADDIFARELSPDGTVGAPLTTACCLNKPAQDSGPLLLPPGIDGGTLGAVSSHGVISGAGPAYFLLDSMRPFSAGPLGGQNDGSRRSIHVAQYDADDPGGSSNGYGPVPLLNTGVDDFSVAFAGNAPVGAQRFYWMSRRNAGTAPELRTVLLGEAPTKSVPVAALLDGCASPTAASDYQPWITPEGTALLFTARCQPADPSRLYVAQPAPDGQLALAKRLPIIGADAAAASDAGASLSPNKCELWFSRDGAIHSASRR